METELISKVLYFGTQRPFYLEKDFEEGIFGDGHYRYVCMQSQLLAVEVHLRSTQFSDWDLFSGFPFVVLNSLRTEAPPF